MTNSRRLFTIALALIVMAAVAAPASAFCCGGATTAYYQPYTSYYAPAYTSYYSPAYTTYYGGWYPGYWMDRIRTRLWGSPTTYVAAYPATYAASYAPAYTASYATSYAPACCPTSYTTSYAPACTTSCSPCSPCTTCYAPSCASCCPGGTSTVTQAAYLPQQPCCNGATQAAAMPQAQPNTVIAPPGTTVIQQNSAPAAAEPAPSLGPTQSPQSTFRQPEASQPQLQPEPATPRPEYNTKDNNSTYLESPKLFNPNDRTAQRSIAPVRQAVYTQPASYRTMAAKRITSEQAQQDAAGWSSAAN